MDLPKPGIKPRSPALQVDLVPSEPPGMPHYKDAGWRMVVIFSFCDEGAPLTQEGLYLLRTHKGLQILLQQSLQQVKHFNSNLLFLYCPQAQSGQYCFGIYKDDLFI